MANFNPEEYIRQIKTLSPEFQNLSNEMSKLDRVVFQLSEGIEYCKREEVKDISQSHLYRQAREELELTVEEFKIMYPVLFTSSPINVQFEKKNPAYKSHNGF